MLERFLTFPVSTINSNTTERTNDRTCFSSDLIHQQRTREHTKHNVDALGPELPTHSMASLIAEVLVPRSAYMNATGKPADEVRRSNAVPGIL